MNTSPRFPLLALAFLVLLACGRSGDAKPPAAVAADGVAIVELFTSQGCSSCPPADRLLSRLAQDPQYRGKVIPLSFHVDYWNHIGWTDPFSSPRWSARQRAYARQLAGNRVYTPQVVVNGRSEGVGSHETKLLRQVSEALAEEPAGRVSLALGAPRADGRLAVEVGVTLSRPAGEGELAVWVAVYERGLVTAVGAGENAAASLRNDHVVRRLDKAFTLPATAGSQRAGALLVALDEDWNRGQLGVAAFLQDPATLAIHGGAAREIP